MSTHGSTSQAHGIEVRVQPSFLPTKSSAAANRFVFSYHITITNTSKRIVQLLHRHWIILDADGERRDVRGAGVVGRQPILRPGQSFEYHSGCPLETSWGTMEGTYTFRELPEEELPHVDDVLDEDDEDLQDAPEESAASDRGLFRVDIVRFYLVASAEESRT